MTVTILTDSTSYLGEEIKKALNIKMVSLNLSFGHESIREVDIDNARFYKMMATNGIPTSSQPSVGDIQKEMLGVIEKGNSLCCIFILFRYERYFISSPNCKKYGLGKAC